MKAIATSIQGLEEVTIKEVKELIKSKAKITIPTKVEFTTTKKNYKKFMEYTRSSLNSYHLLKKLTFKDINDIKKEIKYIKFNIKNTFAVRCKRIGVHKFNSLDVEKAVGNIINKKVNLENPETLIYIDIIDNNCFIGIDFSGKIKRNYRIRLTPKSITPQVAYSLLKISDYKKEDVLLDIFSKSGEISIEAALYMLKIKNKQDSPYKNPTKSNKKERKLKIYAVDIQPNYTRNILINSKIAKVDDLINIQKLDINWLDTRFRKNYIDKAIAIPPYPSKKMHEKEIKEIIEIYKELFNQLKYILKKRGLFTIFTPKPEYIKNITANFKIIKEMEIKIGNQNFFILVYKKTI